jgi:hypothetical protein
METQSIMTEDKKAELKDALGEMATAREERKQARTAEGELAARAKLTTATDKVNELLKGVATYKIR